MKKIFIICFAALCCYEICYRFATGLYGEIDVMARPPKLYYSCGVSIANKVLGGVFLPRAYLPFGLTRLSDGTGAYVRGGRFYRKMQDGSLKNVTELIMNTDMRDLQKK